MLPADVCTYIFSLAHTHTAAAVGLHKRKNRAYTVGHYIYVNTTKWWRRIERQSEDRITRRSGASRWKNVSTYV